VLKRELLADPCLDIVGNRLPNHFLDRHATDSGPELAALPRVEPQVDSVYALRDFASAFDRSMERGKKGKVVLRVADR